MGLKSFHIIFIVASLVLTIAFGVWGTKDFAQSGDWVHLALGIGSFISSGLLAAYGVWFLRKLKGVGYL